MMPKPLLCLQLSSKNMMIASGCNDQHPSHWTRSFLARKSSRMLLSPIIQASKIWSRNLVETKAAAAYWVPCGITYQFLGTCIFEFLQHEYPLLWSFCLRRLSNLELGSQVPFHWVFFSANFLYRMLHQLLITYCSTVAPCPCRHPLYSPPFVSYPTSCPLWHCIFLPNNFDKVSQIVALHFLASMALHATIMSQPHMAFQVCSRIWHSSAWPMILAISSVCKALLQASKLPNCKSKPSVCSHAIHEGCHAEAQCHLAWPMGHLEVCPRAGVGGCSQGDQDHGQSGAQRKGQAKGQFQQGHPQGFCHEGHEVDH